MASALTEFYGITLAVTNHVSGTELRTKFDEWMRRIPQDTFRDIEKDVIGDTSMLRSTKLISCYLQARLRCFPGLDIPAWFGHALVDYDLDRRIEMEKELIRVTRVLDLMLDRTGQGYPFPSSFTGSQSSLQSIHLDPYSSMPASTGQGYPLSSNPTSSHSSLPYSSVPASTVEGTLDACDFGRLTRRPDEGGDDPM